MSRFPMHTFQQDAILARLSEGLVALEVTNVKSLTDEQCNKLQCGDVVVKKTGEQEHAYVVTFKQDKTGMCLTYTDASVVETQSYDYVGGHWVYNSEDKANLGDELPNPTGQGGKVLQVNSGGTGYQLSSIGGVSQLWCHPLDITPIADVEMTVKIYPMLFIFNNSSAPINTIAKLKTFIENIGINSVYILLTGGAKNNDKVVISRGLYCANEGGSWKYYLTGTYADTGTYTGGINITSTFDDEHYSVSDGVNQLI